MNSTLAKSLMDEFLVATGVIGDLPARRYLWTDAFAVTNLLALGRSTGEASYLDSARILVDQVHRVLGRHREDADRRGWISGLSEEEGARHPTAGGLRIGKRIPERSAQERYDERLEWDRDGQYFHYLTKWTHALVRMGEETGEAHYSVWAAELLLAARRAFSYTAAGGERLMWWKVSIDRSRPLVLSMGGHDPLDGWMTCLEVIDANRNFSAAANRDELATACMEFQRMAERMEWKTRDPLGIGGLLEGAARTARLMCREGVGVNPNLLRRLMSEAEQSLAFFSRFFVPSGPASERLAFRELGLAIGMHGVESISEHGATPEFARSMRGVLRHSSLAEAIDAFWSITGNRLNATWREHADINNVMLASSLIPSGYFGIGD